MAPTRSGLLLSLLLTGHGVSSLPSKCPSTLNRRASDSIIPAFSPLGCFTDNEGGVRALSDSSTASDDMTVEKCATFCSRYNIFGVEYGRECFCGNIKADSSREVGASDCSFPCAGDSNQRCGAGDRLNLFTLTAPIVRGPATLDGITSLGCFVDGDPRVLPYNIIGADDMTAAKCAAHCEGYDYFGTQYSRECYCGVSVPTRTAPVSECSMPCAGNPDELCGAGMRLNVYKFDEDADCDCDEEEPEGPEDPESPIPGFDYQGCFTDNVPHRVLSAAVFYDPQMTPAKCAASCAAAGHTWFGTEYGTECYCGNELNQASTKVAEPECDIPCGGDANSKCGDRDRLSIYAANGVTVPAPADNLETIGEFRYSSCYADDVGHRVLEAVDYRTNDMTIEKCAARCESYLYFGLQYANECYCGNELRGGQVATEADCGMLCVGDNTQLCGGPARLNLYTRVHTASSSPVVSSTSAPIVSSASAPIVSSTSAPIVSSTSAPIVSSTSAPIVSSSVDSSSVQVPTSSAVSSSSLLVSESSVISSSSIPVVAPSSSVATSSSAAPVSSASLSIPVSSSEIPSSSPPSSSLPSSTSTAPTTTAGPVLTTITNCPSSSTVDNGYGCYVSGSFPSYCNTLLSSNWNSRYLTSVLTACRRSITTFGNTAAPYTSCFPTSVAATPANSDVAQSTARSVYSCLQDKVYCNYASSCTTNTYEATAVPSVTPTIDIGVNLLQNPSFELTDTPANSNWTFYAPTSANFPQAIVSSRSRSGSRAYQATYLNFNGASTWVTQAVHNLQPLRTYRAIVYYMHQNQAAINTFTLAVNPGGFSVVHDLRNSQYGPNTWHEISIEFTSFTNWLEISLQHNGQVLGNSGTQGGVNVIWADDAWLSRVN